MVNMVNVYQRMSNSVIDVIDPQFIKRLPQDLCTHTAII